MTAPTSQRAAIVPVPANLPADVRLAAITDTSTLRWGSAVLLFDHLLGLLIIGRVRSFTGEAMNVETSMQSVRLALVDDDLDALRDDAAVTDGHRYWMVIAQ